VEEGDSAECVVEVVPSPAMIAEYAPCLEAGDCVLDACPTSAMTTPRAVADDAVTVKRRRDELGDAAITTVSEDPLVIPAELLDA
jgi:hypothetical protein